jgi:hypothetical protein
MPVVKGLGLVVYLRAVSDTPLTQTHLYTAVCAISVDGGGVESSAETQEPCLDDLMVFDYPADPKYIQQTIEYRTDSAVHGYTTTLGATLETAIKNSTLVDYAFKLPLVDPATPTLGTITTDLYATRTAYILSHTDMAFERNQNRKSQIVFMPQTDWVYSTVAPSTS